jgi:hypothetical protein
VKHTNGPWWVAWGGFSGKDPGRVATIYATDDQELRIVAHVPHDMNHAEHEPTPSDDNTLLIAAAPDLLEALQALAGACRMQFLVPEEVGEAITWANAAIDKARGES